MNDSTNETGASRESEPEGVEEVYSRPVKAGRRTYFFDVKATRGDDYYITITESRKRQNKDGSIFYDKHKIYLYKEDFDHFVDGLRDVVGFVKTAKPQFFEGGATSPSGDTPSSDAPTRDL